ncbi:MAG: cyclic nucleotide-binding domain-containing protein, partial [Bacteroidota bacterium]
MKASFQSYLNISAASYQQLLRLAKYKSATKGALIFHPDRTCRKIIFIEQGLLRGYRIIDGKEYTHHFFSTHWFATDFRSFLTGRPGSLYIEALTNCQYYEFPKDKLEALYAAHHDLERL